MYLLVVILGAKLLQLCKSVRGQQQHPPDHPQLQQRRPEPHPPRHYLLPQVGIYNNNKINRINTQTISNSTRRVVYYIRPISNGANYVGNKLVEDKR
jgi:hypothetical protein